jgi:hypothetical protein
LQGLGIVINTLLRVAICVHCQQAILPSALVSHLRSHFKYIEVPPGLADGLQASFKLTDAINWPKKAIEPVFPISIQPNPYLFCTRCNKGYSTENSLLHHQRRHRSSEKGNDSNARHSGYAQSIQFGQHRRNIQVVVDKLVKKTDKKVDYAALFTQQLPGTRTYAKLPVRGPEDDMNLSSFYHRDGWLLHVNGYSAVDLNEAYRFSTPEDKGADILRNLAYRYIKHGQDNIECHTSFGLMRALGSVMPNE